MSSKRIEHIDALNGLYLYLVVYSHTYTLPKFTTVISMSAQARKSAFDK